MLYIVPTPIWNKDDITVRGLKLLSECYILLSENPQTLKKLMQLHDISYDGKQFVVFNTFVDDKKMTHILDMIASEDAVMCSEAGTPWLSDPAKELVRRCREKNIKFEVLPWATALIPAVVGAYHDTSKFVFYGFLPTKKGRQTALKDIINQCDTMPDFLYESVHRVQKLLQELKSMNYDGQVYIAREISKLYEQRIVWKVDDIISKINSKELVIKGEFVIWLWR